MTMTDGGGYGTAFGASAGASGGMRNLRSGRTMLTRSRARDTNQPVFVDDQWNDAYIQTKDEQIDAMHSQGVLRGWEEDQGEGSESDDDDDDGDDSDRWVSDGESDDDDSAGGYGKAAAKHQAGFMEQLWWTLAVVLVLPFAIYASLFRSKRDPWPLQSRSALVAVCKALLNAVTLVVISSLVTRAFCARSVRWPLHAVPSPASWFTSIHQLHWNGCVRRAARRWAQCLSSVSDDNGLEAIGIDCMQPFFHGMALTLGLVATLQFHRLWLKTLLLGGLALTAAVHTATNLRSAQRTAVHIYSLDPSFAYANETIFIAIDGLNMEEGGRIAWAPYWDGARTKKLADTPKVLSRPLHHGGVTVAFTQLDDYIPCYRPPSRSRGRSTEKYECFEHVRLRIKDRRSVPGWSLQHHHDGEEDEEHTAHENAKHAL